MSDTQYITLEDFLRHYGWDISHEQVVTDMRIDGTSVFTPEGYAPIQADPTRRTYLESVLRHPAAKERVQIDVIDVAHIVTEQQRAA